MARPMIQRFDVPSGGRSLRALEAARRRTGEALAERTVWCAASRPRAGGLHARLVRGGARAARLPVTADEPLRRLGERVERMLPAAGPTGLRPADRDLLDEGLQAGQAMVGGDVMPGDVVVLEDSLTAALAEPIRERGAHALWLVRVPVARGQLAFEAARSLLGRYTAVVDAYLAPMEEEPPRRAEIGERVVAFMPAADVLAARELSGQAAARYPDLGWSSLLADIVNLDREEAVGGTLHPRPFVPAR